MFETVLGAIGTFFDSLSLMILSLTLGFAAKPCALGYLVAVIGMFVFGQIAPIAAQSETVVLIASLTKDRNERLTIAVFAEVLILLFGLTGAIGAVVDYIGSTLMAAVMSGVSMVLAKISFGMIKDDKLSGGASLCSAVVIYIISGNLVYTVVGSILVSTAVHNFVSGNKGRENVTAVEIHDGFGLFKPVVNRRTIHGALAAALMILGGTLSDSTVNSQLSGIPLNVNGVFTYTGIGGMLSAMFGGPSLAVIISGTATTPHPQAGAVFMLLALAVFALSGILPKLIKYIPGCAISGFLFTLAVFVVFPVNAPVAFSGNPVVASVTILVTAVTDPFMGIVAGVLMRFLV